MVERYQETTRSRPAAQQDLRVSPTADAFGAAIGRGVNQLGAGVSELAKVQLAKDALGAENEARDALRIFREDTRQLRYNPETGYLNQTGANALGAREGYETAVGDARARAGDRLSPAARREFDRLADSIEESTREAFIRHDSSQLRTYTNQSGEAAAATLLDEAFLNYNNPARFNEFLDRALVEQDRLARLNGWSPDATEQARARLISGAHAGAILRMADEGVGGAVRAQERLNTVAEQITGEDRRQLETVLRPLVLRDRAESNVREMNARNGRPAQVYERTTASPDERAQRNRDVDVLAASRRVAASDLPYNIQYNMNGVRTQPLQAGLTTGISRAVEEVYGAGYRAVVYSGGQPARGQQGPRTGSTRHDDGSAADVYIYGPQGRLSGDDLAPLAQYWLASGQGSVGMEMRGGGVHLDTHKDRARTWNYAAQGGRITEGQQAAIEAGLRGEKPQLRGVPAGEPVAQYFVRNFGEQTGTAIMRASAGATMESVVGVAKAREMGLVGTTVGQYRRETASAFGAPQAPQTDRDGPDFASMIRDAMAIEDPDEREATMKLVAQQRTAHEAASSIERQDTFDQLYERGLTTGNWDLNAQAALSLGAELSAAFRSAAEGAMQGVQNTDPVRYSDLKDMAVTDPEAFANMDLGFDVAGKALNRAAYTEMRDLQRAVRAQLAERPREAQAALDNMNTFEAFNQTAPIFENLLGYDPRDPQKRDQKEQVVQLREELRRRMEQYVVENEGRQPGQAALQRMATEMLTSVQLGQGGVFSGGTTDSFLFDMNRIREPGADARIPRTPHADIPADVRDAVDAMVFSMYGGEIDAEQLRARTELLYTIHQTTNGPQALRGLEPDIELDDVLSDPIVLEAVTPVKRREGRGRSVTAYEVDLPDGTKVTMSDEELRSWYVGYMTQALRDEGIDR